MRRTGVLDSLSRFIPGPVIQLLGVTKTLEVGGGYTVRNTSLQIDCRLRILSGTEVGRDVTVSGHSGENFPRVSVRIVVNNWSDGERRDGRRPAELTDQEVRGRPRLFRPWYRWKPMASPESFMLR